MDEDISDAYISWQGAVTGPYSIKEIRSMLKSGKVNSLYRIQVNGQWILLRDRLAEIDRAARESAKNLAMAPQVMTRVQETAVIQVPRVIPDEYEYSSPAPITTRAISGPVKIVAAPTSGIAITSFVLALLFFIPFLNGITILLSIVFGHLALSQIDSHDTGRSRMFATTALWITYVEAGFLAVATGWFAIMEVPYLYVAYMMLHWQMVGIAITALIGSGLLMLGVRISASQMISFRVCFIGALLPAAINNFGMILIQAFTASKGNPVGLTIATVALFQVVMFVLQMSFWSRFITLPNGKELGLGRAAHTSLFYSAIFIFIGLLYLLLFSVLSSSNFFK